MERYLAPGFNDIGANSVDQDQNSLIRVYMTVSQRNILIMVNMFASPSESFGNITVIGKITLFKF